MADPNDTEMSLDLDTTTEELLLAASNHDISKLRTLLKTHSANLVDKETGTTALHAALSVCEPDDSTSVNGENDDAAQTISSSALSEDGAVETIKLLFENGAIWNDLDAENETPGCVALRLGLKKAYEVIVEAGVRAELLLGRLDGFAVLAGDDDEEEEEEEETMVVNGDEDGEEGFVIVEEADGMVVEDEGVNGEREAEVNSARYLASELTFGGDRLTDADDNGVMMAWETELMRKSVEELVSGPGKRVLNVGHGMGIIDGIFQEKQPLEHHIIEAHPAVLDKMKGENGWVGRPGVTVHEGRWQDIVPRLAAEGKIFDAIYFDTFAEDYKELKDFFTEHVITILDQSGRFGFFNGLGADRQVCYDVYTRVVEMDLFEAGLDTEWKDIPISDLDAQGEWEGIRRKYWALSSYKLPTCSFVG